MTATITRIPMDVCEIMEIALMELRKVEGCKHAERAAWNLYHAREIVIDLIEATDKLVDVHSRTATAQAFSDGYFERSKAVEAVSEILDRITPDVRA